MSLPQTGLGSACAGRGRLIHIRWPPTPSWHPPKLQGLHQASTSAHWHTDAQKGACREHRFRLGGAYCRGWQILLRHPLSSPFPASFPDCKGTIKNLKCSLPDIPAQTPSCSLAQSLASRLSMGSTGFECMLPVQGVAGYFTSPVVQPLPSIPPELQELHQDITHPHPGRPELCAMENGAAHRAACQGSHADYH